jgi:hypothetical protein
MKSEILAFFPYAHLVAAASGLFFAVFLGALLWIFRPRSASFYTYMSELPFTEDAK